MQVLAKKSLGLVLFRREGQVNANIHMSFGLIEKLRIKFCFKHQINIAFVILYCGSFFY